MRLIWPVWKNKNDHTTDNGNWTMSQERANKDENERNGDAKPEWAEATEDLSDKVKKGVGRRRDSGKMPKSREKKPQTKSEDHQEIKELLLRRNNQLGRTIRCQSCNRKKLERIGLKHVPVSQGGNCAYLATSQSIYGSSSKWQTVRNLGARHLEVNKEHYITDLIPEILEETIMEMKTAGEYIDELGQ